MENVVKQFRANIKEYSEKLIKDLNEGGTENFKEFLKFSSQFHKYSLNNRILIQIQNPKATHVASFLKWKQLGRNVKKGEKAIKILAPIFKKSMKIGDNGENVEQIDGMWFKTVPVFDISQTEGEDVPSWDLSKQGNDDKGLYNVLKNKLEKSGIVVTETNLNGPLGVSFGGKISICTEQDQVSKFLTLIHEAAHEILHQGSESKALSKNDKECQAEATAFMVACHFGLESKSSSEYLIMWKNNSENFNKNLDSVIKASEKILEMLNETNLVTEQTNNKEMEAA